jgi:hypothetical protein
MLLLVAAVGLSLGVADRLKRRSDRLFRAGLRYSSMSMRLENLFKTQRFDREASDSLCGYIHWHDAMAESHYNRSKAPWVPGEPDPAKIVCECGACLPGKRIKRFGQAYGNVIIPEIARNRE